MAIFNKKKNMNQEIVVDEWMRDDYILVHDSVKSYHLKPYQKLVILRKPTGQQKCVIDFSLPYSELKKLQQEAAVNGYADIFRKDIVRVIPSECDYDNNKYHKLNNDEVDNISNLFNDNTDKEFEDTLNQVKEEQGENEIFKPMITLKDSSINITLNDNLYEKTPVEDGVDDIDSVKIYIPHEERSIRWDTIEELNQDDELKVYSGGGLRVQEVDENTKPLFGEKISSDEPIEPEISKPVELESLDDIVQNPEVIQEEQVVEENIEDIQEEKPINNMVAGEQVIQDDYVEINDENSTDYQDYQTQDENNQTVQPTYSFFKNQINHNDVQNAKQERNKYSFYKSPENSKYKKVCLNKKAKMITYRRKIDKTLLK